jgi:CRP/FNR family transcriptional regulator, cyclic AMP receptor protein
MARRKERPFDAQGFLGSAGLGKRVVVYARREVIFSQGDPCDSVMFVRSGGVVLSIISHSGKEAIVATLGPGDFLGEGLSQVIRCAWEPRAPPCRPQCSSFPNGR